MRLMVNHKILVRNNIMTFSKQLFSLLFFFLFIFPLQHASTPNNKCSSSFSKPLRCGPLEVPIHFPFCDDSRFNLHCTDLNKTVLELPMSGTFLVQDINYRKQEIYINDPENCLVKRLLNFSISGSPFSSRFNNVYTFFTCANEYVLPYWYKSVFVPCLSNSTFSFYGTSNSDLTESMLLSCKIVKKRVTIPTNWPSREADLSSYVKNKSLILEWDSPNCKSCNVDYSRCGFKSKNSLEVKCFHAKETGHLSKGVLVLIISLSLIGAVSIFPACIIMRLYNSRRFDPPSHHNPTIATRQPTRGLDKSTIESYKKVELGESRRLSGTNGIVCPICLSEYASKETVRFIPKCNHCFHTQSIDVWLKIHGSCPLCRNSTISTL